MLLEVVLGCTYEEQGYLDGIGRLFPERSNYIALYVNIVRLLPLLPIMAHLFNPVLPPFL